jgi:hypothetical protein
LQGVFDRRRELAKMRFFGIQNRGFRVMPYQVDRDL